MTRGGPLHALYVACSYMVSSGARTSTLGTLIIPLGCLCCQATTRTMIPTLEVSPSSCSSYLPQDRLGSCNYCRGFESVSNKVLAGWNHVAWHQETQETPLASVIDLPVRQLLPNRLQISRLILQLDRCGDLFYYALLPD